MAPVEVIQYIDDQVANALKVKNTFLHCPDELDFDDSNDWITRRQASEPAPKRQVSVPVRAADRLEKFEEADEKLGESDSDLDLDDANVAFVRQVSDLLFRQVSDLGSKQNAEFPENNMDRQTSNLSLHGFDKQISVMSAAGFTRQETEQQWPTYATSSFKMAPNTDGSMDGIGSPIPPPPLKDDLLQPSSTAHVLPLEDLLSAPTSPVNADVNNMACMTMMMWPNMPQLSAMDDYVGLKEPAPPPPYKNRRKARSLISLAQEKQRQQQRKLMWSPPNQIEQAPQKRQAAHSKSLQKQLASEGLPAEQAKATAQFCPYCGGKVEQHFKFCRYCGSDVAQLWEL